MASWSRTLAAVGTAAVAGVLLVERAVDSDAPDVVSMFAALSPLPFMVVTTLLIVVVLRLLPIKASSARDWPVQDMTPGSADAAGRFAIESTGLRIDGASRACRIPFAALHSVRADGECLRLAWDEDGRRCEIMLMPRGKPDRPQGRRQQSRVIEQRVAGAAGRSFSQVA